MNRSSESGVRLFSAVLRSVCFVDDDQNDDLLQDEAAWVFQAPDRDAAFLRALELGRGTEHEYRNSDGSIVQWRFERVLRLQEIAAASVNGCEVGSTVSHTDFLPYDTVFEPWAHVPEVGDNFPRAD